MVTKKQNQFDFKKGIPLPISILLETSNFQYKKIRKKTLPLYFENNKFCILEQTKPKLLGSKNHKNSNYLNRRFQNKKNFLFWNANRNKNFFVNSLKKNVIFFSSFSYKYLFNFQKNFQKLLLKTNSFFVDCIPVSNSLIETEYWLQKYQRSNQDTCLNQRPSVKEGEWVQKGDFISDSSGSVSGELALGKNIIVGYMPWEGYNFEDAIVLSDRLVYNAVYTSLHIERYEIQIEETAFGFEEITKQIYELIFPEKFLSKKKYKKKKSIKKKQSSSDSSLESEQLQKNTNTKEKLNIKTFYNFRYGVANKKNLEHLDNTGIVKIGTWIQPNDILVAKVTPLAARELSPQEKFFYTVLELEPAKYKDTSLRVPQTVQGRVIGIHLLDIKNVTDGKKFSGPQRVHIFVAKQRAIQVGDKMAGRHGNKGIVSTILPRSDMPYLPDGTPLDIVLNPLGVPSRMNVGQVFESLLGLSSGYLHQHYKIAPFDEMYGPEASRSLVYSKLYEARLKTGQEWLFQPTFPGKTKLFDGRTGECFSQPITVGRAYILKLSHLVDKKIHARATGPYSLITQQPVRGRAHHGGQRLGEMEVWAFEGFGAAYSLQECLTIKSDDTIGRLQVVTAIVKDGPITMGTPEAFKVVTSELQSLCLNMKIFSSDNVNFKDPNFFIKKRKKGMFHANLQLLEGAEASFEPSFKTSF